MYDDDRRVKYHTLGNKTVIVKDETASITNMDFQDFILCQTFTTLLGCNSRLCARDDYIHTLLDGLAQLP